MSLFQFITSDSPIAEIENPYIKHLSIRQAREMGMELPNFIDENPDIDVDEKVIFICESEDHLDEIEIRRDLAGLEEIVAKYSEKKFSARLDWRYSHQRAQQLKDYLSMLMEQSKEVEVWSVWLDESAPVLVESITESQLSKKELKFLDIAKGFMGPQCLIIKKG